MLGISWLAENRVASQEGLCLMEIVVRRTSGSAFYEATEARDMHKQNTKILPYLMAPCSSSYSWSVSVSYQPPLFSKSLKSPSMLPFVHVNHPKITFTDNLPQPHK
jgi:hypothetical protein